MINRSNAAWTRPKYTTHRAELAQRSREEAAENRAEGLETGWTVFGYMVSGPIAYGLIGWLLARFTHLQFLFPAGLLIGVAVSVGYVIYRYGRPEKQPDKQPDKRGTQTQQGTHTQQGVQAERIYR
jgi:ATP synthase protein I